ncbi:actin-like ATPase domain-containing protein [Mucor ambiguus]|uniref:Actin-like ATPase domain-containing protein n=1 Tax=Mucor ambiguus TaxID=91626 RepID=A0A0C9MIH3_9FUNG|nr:actin-like ATPase domain-containing protein [Mucor ambiguus]
MSDHQHSNNFLKNLSQKKYAWMEEAAAPVSPVANASGHAASTHSAQTPSSSPDARNKSKDSSATASSPTSKKTKKQKLSAEPHHDPSSATASSKSSSTKHKKGSSPPPSPSSIKREKPGPKPGRKANAAQSFKTATPYSSSIAASTENSGRHAEEEDDQPINAPADYMKDQPLFKYTTFPVKGYNILPTRNITSNYAKNDTSYFPGHKTGSEELLPNAEDEWRDTIVIHPGSRNLRIGLASEAFPISVPHVIARKLKTPVNTADGQMDIDQPEANQEEYDYALEEIRGELRWRMKNAKRRAVPNAEGQVIGFNATAVKETILDHNDPYKVEWTEVNKGIPYFVGEKALNVPVSKNSLYSVRYPWKNGTLNNQDYASVNEVLSDLEAIWTDVIVNDLEVERSDFKNCNAVLVIPDKLDHSYICNLVTMMLRYMKFKAVIVQQESTAATYGAGVSSAVVVDIGAQKTNIVCIEDGVCQLESRISIRLGGDDITKTFASFLLKNKFPYADIDLSTTYDWRLAETLKEKWCTMNEADISVQVYDFFARTPFKPTLKYQCKVYDEVFLAPLCLVYPNILQPKSKKANWINKNVTDDVIEDATNPSSSNSNSQEDTKDYDSFPIDVAIAQSIVSAANGSEEKLKRYFTSIILVGGGGKVVNFSRVLEDRVLSTIIAQKANIDRVEVVPAPRELDPEVLVWKGASVMAKLDSAKDMWIADDEWEQVGARCLRERALLM